MLTTSKTKFYISKATQPIILLLFCLALNLAYYFLASRLIPLYYNNNDDVSMKMIASGWLTGVPDGHLIYIKYTLGAVIAYLYSVLPNISWYNIVMMGIILLSMSTILYRMLSIVTRFWTKAIGVVLFFILYTLSFLKYTVFIQFTVTASIPFIAALFWYFTQKSERSRIEFILDTVVCSVLIILSLCLRDSVFFLMMPFAIILMVIRFIVVNNRKEQLRAAMLASAILICSLGIYGIEQHAYSTQAYREYKAFNEARSSVYDYGGAPSYNVAKGIYDKNKISPALVECLRGYSLNIDDRLDTKLFSALANNVKAATSLIMKIKQVISTFNSSLIPSRYAVIMLIIISALLIVILFISIKGKQKSILYLILFFILATVGECLYLSYIGRTIERAVMPILVVLVFTGLAIVWKWFSTSDLGILNLVRNAKTVFIPAILSLAVISALLCANNVLTLRQSGLESNTNKKTEFIQYAQAHKENRYYLCTRTFGPVAYRFLLHEKPAVQNFIYDGGWFSHMPLQIDNLKLNGLTKMNEDLLKDNVYYISDQEPKAILDYYEAEGIAVKAEIVDHLHATAIPVYKFKRLARYAP